MANSGYSQSECLTGEHSTLHSAASTPSTTTNSGLINSGATNTSTLPNTLDQQHHPGVYQQQQQQSAGNQYCDSNVRPPSHPPLSQPPPPPPPSQQSQPTSGSTFTNSNPSQIEYTISNQRFTTTFQGPSQAQSQHINNGIGSVSFPVLNMDRYSDDMNDIFQCGKCKNQFFELKAFVHHRTSDECHLTHLQYSNDKKDFSIDCNSNKINSNAPLESFSSLLNSTSGLVSQSFRHHQTSQQQQQQTQQQQQQQQQSSAQQSSSTNQSLPNSTSYLNSEQCNLTSHNTPILMHYDSHENIVYENVPLSSLTPSLDARMISPSISPSLLHLQGGDASSNTDDFSQYHLGDNDSQLWTETLTTDFNGINFDQQPNPPTGLDKNPQNVFVSTLINSFHSTSPASFATMVHDLSEQTPNNSYYNKTNQCSTAGNQPPVQATGAAQPPPPPSAAAAAAAAAPSSFNTSDQANIVLLNNNTYKALDKSPDESGNNLLCDSQSLLCHSSPEPITVIHHQPDNPNIVTISKTLKKPTADTKTNTSDATFTMLCNNNPLNVVSPPNVTISSESPLPNSTLVKRNGKQQRTPSKSVPSTPEAQIKCEQCTLTFPRLREFENHMLFHSGARRFHCLNCGKTFAKKSSLRKHILSHKQLSEEEIDDLMQKCDVNITVKTKANPTPATTIATAAAAPTTTSSSSTTAAAVSAASSSSAALSSTSKLIVPTNDQTNLPVISPIDAQQSHSSHEKAFKTEPIKAELFDTDYEPVAKKSKIAISVAGSIVAGANTNIKTEFGNDTSELFLQCNFAACDQIYESSAMLKHIQDDHGCNLIENIVEPNGNIDEQPSEATDSQQQNNNIINNNNSNNNNNNNSNEQANNDSGISKTAAKYSCSVCFIQFKTPKAMNDHESRASHKHECIVCLKVFLTDRFMKRHLKRHCDSTTPTCFVCSEMFDTLDGLRTHLGSSHGPNIKNYCCDICDASYSDIEQLKQHQKIHDPSVQHKCPLDGCTKSFNQPDKLKIHILTHYGLKSFPCGFCSRSFTRQSNLMDHMKNHQKPEENCSEDDCRMDEILVKSEPADSNNETFTTLENAATFPNTSDSSNSSSLVSGPTVTSNVVPINNFQVFPVTSSELKCYLIYTCPECGQYFFNQTDLEGHLCAAQTARSELTSSSIINAT